MTDQTNDQDLEHHESKPEHDKTPVDFPQPSTISRRVPRMKSPEFLLTMTRAMLETLELRRTLYVLLSGVTAGDGLNFNRAFLLLQDDGARWLRGSLAIGPASLEEAHRIWEEMSDSQLDLNTLMERYDTFSENSGASALSTRINPLRYSLPLPEPTGADSFSAHVYNVSKTLAPVMVNDQSVPMAYSGVTLRNFAVISLALRGTSLGILTVDNAFNKRPIKSHELDDLQAMANLAAIAVERAKLHQRIRKMAERR